MFERRAFNALLEGLPSEQSMAMEGSPIDLIDFVDRADVRVGSGRMQLWLPLKTAERLRVVASSVGKELSEPLRAELDVLSGLYSHTHPPAANFRRCVVSRSFGDSWEG